LTPGEEPDTEEFQGGTQDDDNEDNGNMTVDFGFVPDMSIGSTVYYDTNDDGDHAEDGSEPGIAGLTVELLADLDGDGEIDDLVATDVTDENGTYFFGNLPSGDYIVSVTPNNSGSTSSTTAVAADDNGGDGLNNGSQENGAGTPALSPVITLTPGQEPGAADEDNLSEVAGAAQDDDDDTNGDMTVDFGFIPTQSVGSTVFVDENGDGTDDPDEPGLEGVTVNLYGDLDGDGDPTDLIATTITDEDGNYLFDTLPPGTYQVEIIPTPEYPASSDGASPADDDVDGVDDGEQDEPGDPITSSVFTLEPNGEPQDEPGPGGDQDADNDSNGNMTVDFGVVPIGTIGSQVFADLDNNGIFDGDDEPIPGVVVELYEDEDMDGIPDGDPIATTVTDDDGLYLFEDLPVGSYVVGIPEAPTDYQLSSQTTDNTENSDGNDDGIQEEAGAPTFSGTVTLTAGNEPTDGDESFPGGDQDDDPTIVDEYGDMTVDFGFTPAVSVGSTVFLDNNNNGINEPNEPGISGVEVNLFTADDVLVATVLTDDDGNYLFDGLPEGDYYITISEEQLMPGGLFETVTHSSTPDFNADDDIDNNDDGAQPGGPGTVITSNVFTLTADMEPVDGGDPATSEFNGGATQDNADDDNGNMTVDFGIFTPMFDLALMKVLAPGQSPNVDAGDTVAFQIRVINQGNIAADSILISDYFPSQTDGFMFDETIAGNDGWSVASVIGDTTRLEYLLTEFNGEDTLAMDSFVVVDLFLVVNPAMEAQMPLTNLAEVSDATGPGGIEVTDIDSPMDTIPGNDPFFEDNEIDGDGLSGGDDDNADPETILVGGFDLALIKTLGEGESNIVATGEEITFDITVINQGAITANNIVVVDYVPDGFLFDPELNPGWSLNEDGNPVDTLSIENGLLFEGGLEPGERTTVQITLTVAPPMFPDYALGTVGPNDVNADGVESGQVLVNEAEIVTATDEEGNEVTDIDSTPDDIQGNDGEIDDDDENGGGDTDGDGVIDDDEDDSDITIVTVECYQDPGVDNTITVCLGCDEAEVVINLFESLAGMPNIGGTFAEGDLIFMDEDGNPIAIDLSDPENVVIPGTLDRSLDYSITYTIAAVNDCPEMISTLTIDIFDIQNLSCTGFQNISLGEDCEAEITPDLVLQGNLICANSLEVYLLTSSGDTLRDANGLPTAIVNNDQINQTLFVSLNDPMCDNNCWGQILVEDKKRPEIECPEDADSFEGLDFICTDLDEIFQDQAIVFNLPDTATAALAFLRVTGIPEVMDNCTPVDELVIQLSDFLIPNSDPQCAIRTILRTFTVTDASGNFTSCVQEITVRPPSLDDVVIPTTEVVEISCNSSYETLPNGNPVPSVGGESTISTAFGTFNIPGNGSYCTIAANFEDSERVVTCDNTFKFVRTFRIFDWCDIDAEPIIYTQLIKVGDFDAPVFTGPTQDNDFDGIIDQGPLVFPTNTGNSCTAIFRLDDPGITLTDNCSDNLQLSAVIYPNGDLSGTPIGTFVVDLNDGDPELTSAIPVGEHILRYNYTDACGNSDFTDIDFIVEDRTAPTAVCEDGLNVSITSGSEDGGPSEGIAVLTPEMLDAGSTDDCSDVTLAIARVNAANIATEAYSQEIRLTCADIGTVRVGLRVTDAVGNENFCWLDVLVEDKQAPICLPPPSMTMTCTEYNSSLPADITETSLEERDVAFGSATGVDNCGATITETISGDVNSCGVGVLTRTFVATDATGLTNVVACTQRIEVIGIHDYQLIFPTDESGECADVPTYNGVEVVQSDCDLITITSDVDTLRTLEAGEECFKLRVTYDVINWCEYNTLGQPYLIPRDGDGIRNPESQLLYLNVLPEDTRDTSDDFAFLSRFSDRNYDPGTSQRDMLLDDGDDTDGTDDDNGNDNIDSDIYAADNSRGHFRYVQFIKIYDDVAPTIVADELEECFGGAGENCEATVTLTFTATDECSEAQVGLELDPNYVVADGFTPVNAASLGVQISLESDSLGNYVVTATNVPVGQHAIRVRASDGCGNFDIEIIEFCVVADKAPTPICIETLTVTLMPDGDGGGAGQIWASDFIASDVEDCFGNVIDKYSIYTESEAEVAPFNPVAGRLGIDFDCDDLGDIPVRVYAIADNGSADFCSVIVNVQANDESVCEDGDPNLAGVIITETMEAIEDVTVTLEGADDMTRTAMTGDDGTFTFTNLPAGADYTVTPSHFLDYLNGVRTSDIVAITRHILGVSLLDSPYKHIAADVDGNTEIDVADIINIRRLILGLSDTYPNDMPSWTFVPADYEFAQLDNPWAAAFPAVYNYNDLVTSVIDADFIGAKLGDVNGSAQPNGRSPRDPQNLQGALELELDEVEMIDGETYRIPVTAPQLTEVDGYQFTFEFDQTALSMEAIEAGLVGEGNFGWRFVNSGLITTSWNWSGAKTPANWTGEEVLFTLVVKAETSGRLSEALEAGSRFTEAEAYARGTDQLRNLSLIFNEEIVEVGGYRLLQNLPNPVRKETTIGYELPEAHAEVTISITDAAGRLVREYRQEGFVGYNSIVVTKRQLGGASGVYSYTVAAGDWVATKRMVIVE
ncbi:MAG: SdrD B-like domain-containing protein, partial [Bacteroidota bacterium]